MPGLRRLVVTALTVLVLVAQGAASWASIEVSGGPSCCCPDPTRCECFDHDGDHHDAPQLKRCARDPVQAALPVQLPAIIPAPTPVPQAPRALPAPEPAPAQLATRHADRPEKPPS